jgi:hypothetical protein
MEAKWEPIDEQRERLIVLKMRVDMEVQALQEMARLTKQRIGALLDREIEHLAGVSRANRRIANEEFVERKIIELDEKRPDITKVVSPDRRV